MLPNLICIVENYNCGSWVVVGVADIDDGLGLDCQTSFNGLGAKGVYREVLIINFTPINSLSPSHSLVHSWLRTWTHGPILNWHVDRFGAKLSSDIVDVLRQLSNFYPTQMLMTALWNYLPTPLSRRDFRGGRSNNNFTKMFNLKKEPSKQ